MFTFEAEKNSLTVKKREMLTAGCVNVFACSFTLSDDFEVLEPVAVFKAITEEGFEPETEIRWTALDEEGGCTVPWEVLQAENARVYVGLWAQDADGTMVLATNWVEIGKVSPGASLTDASEAESYAAEA